MTYLIVGLDKNTFAPWHENIQARDVTAVARLARVRAQACGINLVVAAVIGPEEIDAVRIVRADDEKTSARIEAR